MTDCKQDSPAEMTPSFFQKRFLGPVRAQLVQGANPKGLAKTCAVGGTLAIIPVLGIATFLCVLAGARFKLNQPILQAINYLLYPVQLVLIPIFLKLGARFFRDEPIVFNLEKLMNEFKESAPRFFEHYGMAGFHAFILWILIAPVIGYSLYIISLYLILKITPHKKPTI